MHATTVHPLAQRRGVQHVAAALQLRRLARHGPLEQSIYSPLVVHLCCVCRAPAYTGTSLRLSGTDMNERRWASNSTVGGHLRPLGAAVAPWTVPTPPRDEYHHVDEPPAGNHPPRRYCLHGLLLVLAFVHHTAANARLGRLAGRGCRERQYSPKSGWCVLRPHTTARS